MISDLLATIRGLRRSSIKRNVLVERVDDSRTHSDRVIDNDPFDAFCAGRYRQRTRVSIHSRTSIMCIQPTQIQSRNRRHGSRLPCTIELQTVDDLIHHRSRLVISNSKNETNNHEFVGGCLVCELDLTGGCLVNDTMLTRNTD